MKFILTPVGSEGDLYPFVALSLLLKQRGHDVLLVHNEHFTELLHKIDVPKLPLGAAELYLNMARNPDLWHPTKSLNVIGNSIAAGIEPYFSRLLKEVKRGPCVLVCPTLAVAARIIQDLTGLKAITIHLQPAAMPSVYDTPELPIGSWIKRAPKFVKAAIYKGGSFLSDRTLGPPVNKVRKKVGLKPVRNILLSWTNSPDGVMCLFPAWYAEKQPDWPQPIAHATFPTFDRPDLEELDPEVASFFKEHQPVVVTHGTANYTAKKFFEQSILALAKTGQSGAILTREGSQLPRYLPSNVRHFTFLPFSQVLPLCSGIVHHGGMGTTVQALKSGCPQLIVPMAHDQFDNGARTHRMGAGEWCPNTKYNSQVFSAWIKSVHAGKFREGSARAASKMGQEYFQDAVVRAFSDLGIKI